MSEIMSELITPQVQFVGILILIFVALLYVLSVIWVVRDSYLRGASPTIWGIIALVPFIGCLVYAMLRPPLYASDREEQNISLLLQQRQLMQFGECPQCGYPTERAYILCPNCHTRLREQCSNCGNTLEPEWAVCPFCGSRAGHGSSSGNVHYRQVSDADRTHVSRQHRKPNRNETLYAPVETTVETITAEEDAEVNEELDGLGNAAAAATSRPRARTSSAAPYGRHHASRTPGGSSSRAERLERTKAAASASQESASQDDSQAD